MGFRGKNFKIDWPCGNALDGIYLGKQPKWREKWTQEIWCEASPVYLVGAGLDPAIADNLATYGTPWGGAQRQVKNWSTQKNMKWYDVKF